MTTGMMRLKIGDDTIKDISTWKLELIRSPQKFGMDIKDNNIVSVDFPEMDGDVFYIPTTPKIKAFDYTITLAFISSTLNEASEKISAFCNLLKGKKTVIYNDYKGVQLEGYYKSHSDGEFYRDTKAVTFDITFYVPQPQNIVYL
jgi:hypothetical protein